MTYIGVTRIDSRSSGRMGSSAHYNDRNQDPVGKYTSRSPGTAQAPISMSWRAPRIASESVWVIYRVFSLPKTKCARGRNSKHAAMDRPHTRDMSSSMYENRSGMVVGVITVCLIVATVFVGLRFYVRFGIIKKLGADDWVQAAALVCLPLTFLEPPS